MLSHGFALAVTNALADPRLRALIRLFALEVPATRAARQGLHPPGAQRDQDGVVADHSAKGPAVKHDLPRWVSELRRAADRGLPALSHPT